MAYRLLVFTLGLFSQVAFGALEQTTAKVAPFLSSETNMVLNPSCAKNDSNITDADAIVSRNTTNALDNGSDCAIDADADTEFAEWASVDLSASADYLSDQNCEASMYVDGDASLYTMDVYIDTALQASVEMPDASSGPRKVRVNFPCGDLTDDPKVRVTSTSASAAAINVARVYLGAATNIGPANLPTVFSALVSSGGVITNQTGDWLDSCSWASAGVLDCLAKEGVFTQVPNCTAVNQGSRGVMSFVAATSNAIELDFQSRNTTTDAAASDSVVVSCQKAGADFEATRQAVTPDLADLSGFAKHEAASACSWVSTSATMAVYSADSDCTTPTVSGNLTAPATKIPAAIATTIKPGKYMVLVGGDFRAEVSTSGNQQCSFEVYDGTSSGGISSNLQGPNLGRDTSTTIVGQFEYDSLQTNVQFQIRARRDTGNGNCSVTATPADLTFTLIPLSQGTPAPLLTDSVTTTGGGIERIVRADVECDGSSQVLATSGDWLATIGNISSGQCAYTFESGVFSDEPACTAISTGSSAETLVGLKIHTKSSSGMTIKCSSISSAPAYSICGSYTASIICMGPR